MSAPLEPAPSPSPPRRRSWKARLALVAGSALVTSGLLVLALHLYSRSLGIREPTFAQEHQVDIFRPDPALGYRTKTNLSTWCFGTIHLETNERGFRGTRPTPAEPAPGTHRLIGIGDSVTWGIAVNEPDTFLGRLAPKLAQNGSWEVINAGVIGYGTWQESLYLERVILPLKPGTVIVNYCPNDVMSSEDPFNRIRKRYAAYVEELRDNPAARWSVTEKEHFEWILRLLDSARFKEPYESATAEQREFLWDITVGRPMKRMAELARPAGVRLVFLFIPSYPPGIEDGARTTRWKKLLTTEGVEWLDVATVLAPSPGELPPITQTLVRWGRPVPSQLLRGILLQRRINEVQARNKYIDFFHPTRNGNELIAGQLHAFLTGGPLAEGVEFNRKPPAGGGP